MAVFVEVPAVWIGPNAARPYPAGDARRGCPTPSLTRDPGACAAACRSEPGHVGCLNSTGWGLAIVAPANMVSLFSTLEWCRMVESPVPSPCEFAGDAGQLMPSPIEPLAGASPALEDLFPELDAWHG